MPDGLWGQLSILVPLLAALLAVAAAVWRSEWRACRRCGAADHRAWRFCPNCGLPRGDGHETVATLAGTKTVTAPLLAGGLVPILPSDLLRRGWCREEALSDSGYEVSPTSPAAVAWSISGACDRAFEPHTRPWRAWRKGLEDILRERYGGVSARLWNRHPARRRATVLAIAEEVERRAGLARDGGRGAPKGASDE